MAEHGRLIDADALKERLKQPIQMDKERADRLWEGWHECTVAVDEAIDDMPTIEPERNCSTCRYNSNEWDEEPCDGCTCGGEENHWKPTIEQKRGDAISRSEAIRVVSGYCHPSNIADELEKLPSVRPERSKGWWMQEHLASTAGGAYAAFRCSNCQSLTHNACKTTFCPNCGADMRQNREDEA